MATIRVANLFSVLTAKRIVIYCQIAVNNAKSL